VPTLLVLGGSQGATGLNDPVRRMLVDAPQRWSNLRIIHQTGAAQHAALREFYARLGRESVVEPFFSDMADQYRKATLVVSRAGATTLAELACAGLPVVLVPYPQAADNHQFHNAEHYRAAGGAEVVLQRADPAETAGELARVISTLLDDRQKLDRCGRAMRLIAQPDAARNVAQVLQTLSPAPIK
jgi:UDP-N-acetylglucosamine--N-acetylmuramyl-(pentapeptide) pyrophosphoryl-undecaprenol N-acetylglucosamine transferase